MDSQVQGLNPGADHSVINHDDNKIIVVFKSDPRLWEVVAISDYYLDTSKVSCHFKGIKSVRLNWQTKCQKSLPASVAAWVRAAKRLLKAQTMGYRVVVILDAINHPILKFIGSIKATALWYPNCSQTGERTTTNEATVDALYYWAENVGDSSAAPSDLSDALHAAALIDYEIE